MFLMCCCRLESAVESLNHQLAIVSQQIGLLVNRQAEEVRHQTAFRQQTALRQQDPQCEEEDLRVTELHQSEIRHCLSLEPESPSQVKDLLHMSAESNLAPNRRNNQSLLLDMFTRPDTNEETAGSSLENKQDMG